MSLRKTGAVVLALTAMVALSSCGNTIRGVGKDAANAVDATQDAGRSVDRAASR